MSKEKIIKSRDRVRNQAEVFTQEREVKNILALTQAVDNIFWRFLEPACGSGNFLVEIVRQRLERISQTQRYRPADNRQFAIVKMLSTIYGVDIAEDNILESKERIKAEIKNFLPRSTFPSFSRVVDEVLNTNIILGDMLEGKENIYFVEYNLLPPERFSRTNVQRKIYHLLDMEAGNDESVDELPIVSLSDMSAIDPARYQGRRGGLAQPSFDF